LHVHAVRKASLGKALQRGPLLAGHSYLQLLRLVGLAVEEFESGGASSHGVIGGRYWSERVIGVCGATVQTETVANARGSSREALDHRVMYNLT